MTAELILNVVVQGAMTGLVYGLMALGLSVIFGVVHVVNFAHGEFAVLAMYMAFVAFVTLGVDPILAALPIAAILFAIGYAMQRLVVNRFVGRPEHEQFILMVAVAMILLNLSLMAFGPDGRPVNLPYALDSYLIGPLIVDKVRLVISGLALLVAAALFAFFRLTRMGTAIRACADNLTGAAVVGLDVKRLYAWTFGIGLACVGLAGAMLVTVVDVSPTLAPGYTLLAFTIVIVGGLGSLTGALVGGVLIGVCEALSGFLLQPSMKTMFSFLLLVAILVLRPRGLMGARR
jgi:branched-chain amino acid transport system permease protein